MRPFQIASFSPFLFLLFIKTCMSFSGSSFVEEGFLATSLFNVTASSTCGMDTPPTADLLLNCSAEDHSPAYSTDRDLNTWWQSEEGDDPAVITFTLKYDVSLAVTGLRLHIRSRTPEFYAIEIYDSNSNLNGHFIFVSNGSLCSQQSSPCREFSPVNSTIELAIPAIIPVEPLHSIHLLVANNGVFSAMENYHTIAEVELYAQIIPGHYARSLSDIRVEGEVGTLVTGVDLPTPVAQNSSSEQFPAYTGRGYAVLSVLTTERIIGQWIIPSLPVSGDYQILLLYSNNNRKSRRLDVTINQNDLVVDNLFVDINGTCSRCTAVVSSSPPSPIPYNFTFNIDMLTINIVLTTVDILLDAIIAFPLAFSEYEGLIGNVTERELFMNTSRNRFRAQQLSIEFYMATYPCDCASSDVICDPTGGQCQCDVPTMDGFTSPTGRVCNQCSLNSYLTVNGCVDCSCPINSTSCDLETGQCDSCPDFSFGPMCEQCIANSYRDNGFCRPCECNDAGTAFCNSTTGECHCKEGVGGLTCEQCINGFFNYSTTGCTNCNCGLGSTNTTCDDAGRCNCRVGVAGLKCSECAAGFFALSSAGCTQCQCSDRTNDCILALNSTVSNAQEDCSCPFPYTGLSCESCVVGYYMSSTSDACEPCQCNDRADECKDQTGECINCRNNSSGMTCERCVEGTYNVADPSDDISCQPCPCSAITAINSSCMLVEGVATCYCRSGHEGAQCSSCSNGFFGSPPATRCTDCSCNGNIDTTVPQSCDPATGVCLACTNNATGPECELCQDGFYGDATSQSCQPCNCDVRGSRSLTCDKQSGQCECLNQVTGLQCNECQAGSWNLTTTVGCQDCSCSSSSNGSSCDQGTGQCVCLTGVTGQSCSACQDGFYNLRTGQGCLDCGCGLGAVSGICSSTGTCFCLQGVTGLKCDQCLPFHDNLSVLGCQRCSQCEVSLNEQLLSFLQVLSVVEYEIIKFQQEVMQDVGSDLLINSKLSSLSSLHGPLLNSLNEIEENLHDLNETSLRYALQFSERTSIKAIQQVFRTVEILPYAQSVHRHVITVHNMMQDLFTAAGYLNADSIAIKNGVTNYFITANQIFDTISLLSDGNITDLFSGLDHRILTDVLYTRVELATLASWQVMQLARTSLLLEKVSNFSKILSLVELEQLHSLLLFYSNSCSIFLNSSTSIQDDDRLAAMQVQMAMARANESEYVLATAESLLIVVQTDIQSFSLLNKKSNLDNEISGSGRGGIGSENEGLGSGNGGIGSVKGDLGSKNEDPGSGSGTLASGSKLTPAPVTEESFAAITFGLQSLARDIGQIEIRILQWSDYLQGSANTTQFYNFAESLNKTLLPSLDSGSTSVNLILNYSATLNTLNMVFYLSNQISAHLENISNFISLVQHENTSLLVANARNISERLLSLSLDESTNVMTTLASLQGASILAENAARTADNIDTMRSSLELNAYSLARNVSYLRSHINLLLISVDIQVRNSFLLAADVPGQLSCFITTSNRIINQTRLNQEVYNLADSNLANGNDSIQTANNAHEESLTALIHTDIINLANTNEKKLEALNASYSNLSAEVRRAFAAAEMIDLALQFFGNSSLSYPIPSISDGLESISIAVKPTQTNGGVILSSSPENQNEFGVLEVVNGSLQFRCDQERVVLEGESLENDEWYQIYVTRDNEELKLSLSSFPQNGSSYKGTTVLMDVTCSLLDEVTYLGGDGTLPSGFIGCIDRVILNSYRVPLFAPKDRNITISSCGLRPPLQRIRERDSGAWLLGAGSFIRVGSISSVSSNFTIGIVFRTFDSTGLLFVSFNNNARQYLTIYLSNGRLEVHLTVSAYDPPLNLRSYSEYNSGSWHHILLTYHNGLVTATIDESEVLSGQASNVVGSSFLPFDQVYIGGLPEDNVTLFATMLNSTSSTAGCIDQFQIDDVEVDFSKSESYRVDFDGCPDEVVSGVRFTGQGGAEFISDELQLHNLSFSYRSTQLNSLLLQTGNLTVSIFHTKIKVSIFNTNVFSVEANLSDNVQHTVLIDFIYTNQTTVILTVSGGSPVITSVPQQYSFTNRIFVGGTSGSQALERFRGCMDNFTVNGRVMDFNAAELLLGVSLYGCHPPAIPQVIVTPPSIPPPPPPLPPPPSLPPMMTEPVGLSGRSGTFLSFRVTEQAVISSFSILLEFRTSSSDGLLLFMQDNDFLTDFLSLQLRSSRLLFSYNLGSGSSNIESMEEYNDGFLHRVELVRSGRHGQMIIDNGTEVVSGVSNGSYTFLNARSEYLFIGGLPEAFNKTRLRVLTPYQPYTVPVLACVSAFAINGVFEDLSAPQAANDIEPCLPVYNNLITLQNNSYVQFFDNFDVGVNFAFSVNFVTTNCNGLLLYVASSIYSDHLLVELRNGRVILIFDNGPQLETLQYSGSSLCDGSWHSLKVTKNEQRGSISVDGGKEQTVTSLCDSCSQFSATNTNGPVYIGGLPESVKTRHTVQNASFQGCLSNFRTRKGDRNYKSVLFSQARDHSGVQFDVCSAMY